MNAALKDKGLVTISILQFFWNPCNQWIHSQGQNKIVKEWTMGLKQETIYGEISSYFC